MDEQTVAEDKCNPIVENDGKSTGESGAPEEMSGKEED